MLTTKDLLEAGVHFGHQCWRANPKMVKFILKKRVGIFGIDVLDVVQSLQQIEKSCAFLTDASKKKKKILFVGTKIQASKLIKEAALETNSFYVNEKWIGGFLTNWQSAYHGISTLNSIEDCLQNSNLSKSESARLRKKALKLNKCFAGVRNLTTVPDIVIIIGQLREKLAVDECQKLGIPLITVVDTNCNPELTDFAIPCNDDSASSIKLILDELVTSIKLGQLQ